ncbi:putative methyltransferase family protein [Nicoletella semolina]|uniref:Putative methyltransferase family protein n=1 Tax=Nicoletella semolina TaxID=271160 RepID=A0A4V2SK41_9PAST|nr:class I SAM-dependent methyltransferase [Nicoletella semolina]MDH2923935.1 hypothetical protein [Nicoletella semolina]TCP18056.1 putative methyltransferase family protein [Nicoletella semolina]
MSNIYQGYNTDTTYTYGYYLALNPSQIIMPFLASGIAPPEVINACELGFGQGVTINMNAVNTQTHWYGTDFNPSHAAFAQHLNQISGAGSVLSDQGFDEFCQRDDLPEFDFIALHGIWSWISDHNRQVIIDFVRRKLKIGGVLYISYNTLPGWSAAAPIRHLMAEHHRVMSATGTNHFANLDKTLNDIEQIFEKSPRLLNNNPNISARLKDLKEQNKSYIIHEYLNQNWYPQYFSEIEQMLHDAKVSYACSANYLNDFAETTLNNDQKQILATISNPSFAQTVKDFFLNTQFRADYWVKGKRELNSVELKKYWYDLRVMLKNRDQVKLEASHVLSTELVADIFNPILDLLADNKPKAVAQIAEKLTAISDEILFQILTILHAKGDLVLVLPDEQIEQNKTRTQALNRYLLSQAHSNPEVLYLASPVTGTAFSYNHPQLLFLSAYLAGENPKNWGKYAVKALEANNLLLKKDGEILQDPKDNLAEARRQAEEFLANGLEMAKRLGIVE